MAYGLQVWDAAGNLTIEYSSRVPRFVQFGNVASVVAGATSGTINVTGMAIDDTWHVLAWVTATQTYPFFTINKSSGSFTITNNHGSLAATYSYVVSRM